MLEHIIPFRYLTPAEREALVADASDDRYAPGDVLIRQGDEDDRRVFLILEGRVAAMPSA